MNNKKLQVVYTNPAKCRDCYRCVRVCPVNAIQMNNAQANVIAENVLLAENVLTNVLKEQNNTAATLIL